MKECEIKRPFIGFGTADAYCPYEYPSCIIKTQGACGYLEKYRDLELDARSVRAEWRAERGGKGE